MSSSSSLSISEIYIKICTSVNKLNTDVHFSGLFVLVVLFVFLVDHVQIREELAVCRRIRVLRKRVVEFSRNFIVVVPLNDRFSRCRFGPGVVELVEFDLFLFSVIIIWLFLLFGWDFDFNAFFVDHSFWFWWFWSLKFPLVLLDLESLFLMLQDREETDGSENFFDLDKFLGRTSELARSFIS